MKTAAKQWNEQGPHTSKEVHYCYCCHNQIEPGQEFYRAIKGWSTCRHTTCLRNPTKKVPKDETRQVIGQATNGRVIRSTNAFS